MIVNVDCVRDILLYLQSNLKVKRCNSNEFRFLRIPIAQVIGALKDKYDQEDIWYALHYLNEDIEILIEGKTLENTDIFSGTIKDITPTGYELLQTIESSGIWEITKQIADEVGNHSLFFMKEIAQKIAIKMATAIINKRAGE